MKTSPELVWRNEEAELNLIACMLSDKTTIKYCVSTLEPVDFYEPQFRSVFATIKNLWNKNKPIDLISVSAEGHDMSELATIMNYVIPSGYRNHVAMVKTLSMKRQAAVMARSIIRELGEKQFDKPEEVAQYIANKTNLTLPKFEEVPEDMKSIVDETISHLEGLATGEIKAIPYGMRDLDKIMGGLWQSEFTIIAAGPATGKTAFALDISANAAKNGFNVELFSREMNRIQVATRLLSNTRLIKAEDTKKPKSLFENQGQALVQAAEMVSKLPISIDQTTTTIQQLRNKCERKRENEKLDLVVIDYLQLLKSSDRHESRRLEIEHISRELKLMSRDLNIPVVALSQLNREGQKVNARPKLNDLRESGALEQDADNVIFLYNPKPDETISADIVEMEIIIGKQRNGRTGNIRMMFNKQHMKFYGMER
jgi:replicative DNA helicase